MTAAVVAGDSMAPGLLAGDWVVIRRTRRVRPGQVVAFTDPRDPRRVMVKRIQRATGSGWYVLGDNPPRSTDSRDFGSVPPTAVLGRVLFRYHRRGGPTRRA